MRWVLRVRSLSRNRLLIIACLFKALVILWLLERPNDPIGAYEMYLKNKTEGASLLRHAFPSRALCDPHYSATHAIVTAISGSHMVALQWFIVRASLYAPCETLIIYDLGLELRHLTWLQGIKRYDAPLLVRPFHYARYPDYFDVRKSAGEYAWKPVIVEEVLQEFEYTIWMDSGTFLDRTLEKLYRILTTDGFYSTQSGATMREWTHPKALEYFGVPENAPFLEEHPCFACFLGFYRPLSLRSLVTPWAQCARIRSCIAPLGSHIYNHRQDQAALSILVFLSNNSFGCGVHGESNSLVVDNMAILQVDNAFRYWPPFSPGGFFRMPIPMTLSGVKAHFCSSPVCKQPGFHLVDILRFLLVQHCSHVARPHFLHIGRLPFPHELQMKAVMGENSTMTGLTTDIEWLNLGLLPLPPTVVHIDTETTHGDVRLGDTVTEHMMGCCGALVLSQRTSRSEPQGNVAAPQLQAAWRSQLDWARKLVTDKVSGEFSYVSLLVPGTWTRTTEHTSSFLLTVVSSLPLDHFFRLEGVTLLNSS